MTASPYFFVLRSSMTMSRMKFEGRGSDGELMAASIVDEFATLILFVFYMGRGDSRRLSAIGERIHVIICVERLRAVPAITGGGRRSSILHGKLHSVRSSAPSSHLRQEDLSVVRAA